MDHQLAKEKATRWIDENQNVIIEFLQELIRVPSVNPWFFDYKAPSKEADAQDVVQRKLECLEARIDRWEPDASKMRDYTGYPNYHPERSYSGRPDLVGVIPGFGDGRSLMLTGHIDVVKAGAGWDSDPFSGKVCDGKILGRGAADQKGGIAAMIMAINAIIASGIKLAGTVTIGTLVDEEADGMGILSFVDRGYRADACIFTEPTDLIIAPLCRGILWGKLVIEGRSGHIEIPQGHWSTGGAVDAIHKARMVMDLIDELNYDWSRKKVHPLLTLPCQINVAQIQGGEYPTAFANKVEIVFNAQYLPSERDKFGRGGKVKKEIENFISAIEATDEWFLKHPIKVAWLVDADCAETPTEHPIIKVCGDNMASLGLESKIEGTCFHTDMGWMVNSGIPTINFGPGDPRVAHQDNENITVKDLLTATKVIANTAIDWCGVV